jgi:hypothetical protein
MAGLATVMAALGFHGIWTYLAAGIVLLVIAWPSFSRQPVRPATPSSEEPEVHGS